MKKTLEKGYLPKWIEIEKACKATRNNSNYL